MIPHCEVVLQWRGWLVYGFMLADLVMNIFFSVVTGSLPPSIGIGEDDGTFPICVTISAMGITERGFDLILSNSDNTGIIIIMNAMRAITFALSSYGNVV